MSDAGRRSSERDNQDARILRERLRCKEVSSRAVLCAAYLGHAPAQAALDERGPRPSAYLPPVPGLVALAGTATWRTALLLKICEFRGWLETPLAVERALQVLRERLAPFAITAFERVLAESRDLPRNRVAFEASLEALSRAVESPDAVLRLPDDPPPPGPGEDGYEEWLEGEEWVLFWTENNEGLVDMDSGEGIRLHRGLMIWARSYRRYVDALATGADPDPGNLDSIRWNEREWGLFRDYLIPWLLGPDGPEATDESSVFPALQLAPEETPDDRALVTALEAASLQSPAQRAFVTDLRRRLSNEESLTPGQRERAARILSDRQFRP